MSTADITAFIQAEGKVRFDEQLRMDLDWQEVLDENRLTHFLNLSKISPISDTAGMLFNLGAGDYKNGTFYLNHTGVLFFAKQPIRRLFHVIVVCALFKGTNKAYILDRKELIGNLLENVEEALLFLKKHLQLRWEITSQSTRRKEILELPEVALREAMVNAVCHRDYLEQGAQIMVEIFDDRVEIYNPGGLPKGLPASEFGKRSVCRNPLIASLLLRCNYIEKMGTGIERIRTALEKEHCPKVNIGFNTMFTLEFPRPTYLKTDEKPEAAWGKTREETRKKAPEKITPQATPQVTPQVTRQVTRLLKVLQGEMTRGAIMKKLGLKDRMHFSKKYLTRAIDGGYIEMTIPDKPNSRFQRYRRTEKGNAHVPSWGTFMQSMHKVFKMACRYFQ
ncbi:MAG: ATP-dependent DNA helicase RecG [Desulfobacteraceae bacterium Eth-SRB2]|nr:MAG: ATP-dependent DNA helicase RecG [Desulfobacteraceae bacterium Eth-SRB2]